MNYIIDTDGEKCYYLNSINPNYTYTYSFENGCCVLCCEEDDSQNPVHREDGPAVINSWGTKEWFYYGKNHRLDGPAIEYVDGTKEWYYHGDHIDVSSQEEFEKILKMKAFL